MAGHRAFQSVAKHQNPVSIQSAKQEEASGLRVHTHQLPAPDKDPALITKYSEADKGSGGTGTLSEIRPGHNQQL